MCRVQVDALPNIRRVDIFFFGNVLRSFPIIVVAFFLPDTRRVRQTKRIASRFRFSSFVLLLLLCRPRPLRLLHLRHVSFLVSQVFQLQKLRRRGGVLHDVHGVFVNRLLVCFRREVLSRFFRQRGLHRPALLVRRELILVFRELIRVAFRAHREIVGLEIAQARVATRRGLVLVVLGGGRLLDVAVRFRFLLSTLRLTFRLGRSLHRRFGVLVHPEPPPGRPILIRPEHHEHLLQSNTLSFSVSVLRVRLLFRNRHRRGVTRGQR